MKATEQWKTIRSSCSLQDRTQHRPTTDSELCTREAYLAQLVRTNLRAVVETPLKTKSTALDIPPAAELLHLHAVPEVHEDEKEQPTRKPAEDEEMQVKPLP